MATVPPVVGWRVVGLINGLSPVANCVKLHGAAELLAFGPAPFVALAVCHELRWVAELVLVFEP